MKDKLLFVANWKLHKTLDEVSFWLQSFDESIDPKILQEKEVVICPSFVLIPFIRQSLFITSGLRALELGAQNVSHLEEGAFTGEVSAKQLRGIVDYCIVGHSERRKIFHETNKQVAKKVELCLKYEITPVVCVSKIEEAETLTTHHLPLTTYQFIVAYEPLFAIGSGQPDTPEHAQKMALAIKAVLGQNTRVIYGGSVDSGNAKEFLAMPDISGLLVGNASLDAKEFAGIVQSSKCKVNPPAGGQS